MRRVALLALGVVALSLLVLLTGTNERRAAEYYAKALETNNISETVIVDGESVHVERGKANDLEEPYDALRLAYAKAAARRSPFFALAGTDPEQLTAAIGKLKSLQEELARYQPNEEYMRLVDDGLYPIELLEHLTKLEELRRLFLEQADQKNELAYEEALTETREVYERSLRNFLDAFEEAVRPEARSHVAGTNVVSRKGVIDAANLLKEAVQRVDRKLHQRVRCLEGGVMYCASSDLTLPAPAMRAAGNPPPLLDEIVSLFERAGETFETPFVLLSQSSCAREEIAPIFGMRAPLDSSDPRFVLLGDLRLVESERHLEVAFMRFLHEKGARYVPRQPSNYYECPEYANDHGRILATLATRSFAEETPLSAIAGERKALLELEERLAADIIHESDAVAYLAAAQELSLQGFLPETLNAAIASLSLQFADQSTRFDTFINAIIRIEKGNLALGRDVLHESLDAPYLFFVRNAFPALFFSNNSSITGEHAALFEKNVLPETAEPYVYYSSLHGDAETRGEIVNSLRIFNSVYGQ